MFNFKRQSVSFVFYWLVSEMVKDTVVAREVFGSIPVAVKLDTIANDSPPL